MARAEGAFERVREDATWKELLLFLPDVGKLLWRVARDRRVPWHAKAVAVGAVTYIVSPVDVVPDLVPGLGQLDDLLILAKAVQYLFNHTGYDLLRELWDGSDDGFTLLLVVAGIER